MLRCVWYKAPALLPACSLQLQPHGTTGAGNAPPERPPSIQPKSILPSALRGACVGHLLPLCRLRGLCCFRLLRFDFYWPTIQRPLYFKEASITAKDCLRQVRDLQQRIVRADPEHFSFDDGGMSLFSSLIKATAVTPRKEAFHCEAPNER